MLHAYSWELIESNNNRGLGEYSESGLEHNNKFLRFFRVNLARKTSQVTNLHDCIDRLWLKSDPGIRDAGPKKLCSKCKKNTIILFLVHSKSTIQLNMNLFV